MIVSRKFANDGDASCKSRRCIQFLRKKCQRSDYFRSVSRDIKLNKGYLLSSLERLFLFTHQTWDIVAFVPAAIKAWWSPILHTARAFASRSKPTGGKEAIPRQAQVQTASKLKQIGSQLTLVLESIALGNWHWSTLNIHKILDSSLYLKGIMDQYVRLSESMWPVYRVLWVNDIYQRLGRSKVWWDGDVGLIPYPPN